MNYVGLLSRKNIYFDEANFDNRNIKGSSSHILIYKKIIHQLRNTMKFSV